MEVVALVLPTVNHCNRNGSSPSKNLISVGSPQWFAVKHILQHFFAGARPTTGTVTWIKLS